MKRALVLVVLPLVCGCLGTQSPPEQRMMPASGQRTPSDASAVRPAKQLAMTVLQIQVEYPATRGEVAQAVTYSPELTDGEKKWIVERLPKRFYKNADEVAAELGLRRRK